MTDEQTDRPLSALLSFTAENARSYRDEVHLSLLAGRLTPKSIVRTLPTAGQPVQVLPAAGIFGPNASGKSTLLRAMADLRTLVLESFRPPGGSSESSGALEIRRHPFGLVPLPSPGQWTEDDIQSWRHFVRPTRYEIDLIIHGVRWQYGLEVNPVFVAREYAYHYPHGRQALVFRRERIVAEDGDAATDDILYGATFRSSGRTLQPFVRPQVPLLSIAGAANYKPLAPLFAWFRNNLHFNERADRERHFLRTVELLEKQQTRKHVVALLRAADLGIVDAVRDPVDPEFQELASRVRSVWSGGKESSNITSDDDRPLDDSIRLIHSGPHGDVELSHLDESLGTLVWVGFIGPVLDALAQGSVLLVDELDASLHPRLVEEIVELFQRPRRNPNAAQLIFNAHDVTLLGDSSERTLGRDQVWITEKQSDGATTLYPLSDFRPRHDEAISRRYMQGRYGGAPIINPAGFEQLAHAAGV
ncbi:MAG: AAA family ATPase [bacterium]|nr:AAA family ATPase [bacterium]